MMKSFWAKEGRVKAALVKATGLLGLTVVACLAASTARQATPIPMRLLVTHDGGSADQVEMLLSEERSEDTLRKANLELIISDSDYYLLDLDLYNMRQMEACINGFEVLTRLLREKKSSFKFGDLSDADQMAVREILLIRGLGETAGSALFDKRTPVYIGMSFRTQIKSKGETHTVQFQDGTLQVDQGDLQFHGQDTIQKFVKEELPAKKRKRHQIHELRFRSDLSGVASSRRTHGIGAVSKILEGRLKAQDEAYTAGLKALVGAYHSGSMPVDGQKALGLSERSLAHLRARLQGMPGLANDSDVDRFLEEARFGNVTPIVTLSVGWMSEGSGRTHTVQTNVRRGG